MSSSAWTPLLPRSPIVFSWSLTVRVASSSPRRRSRNGINRRSWRRAFLAPTTAAAKPRPGRAKGPSMKHPIEIENIEGLRRREGIDDAELREEVRRLRVGDLVHLTFRMGTQSGAGETLLVRITGICGCAFRGELIDGPASTDLSKLHAGSLVAFTTDH